MLLLRAAEFDIELFEAAFADRAACLQRFELGGDLCELVTELAAPRIGRIGLLRQAQELDLQLMRARLCFARFASRQLQALRCFGIGGLEPHRGAARFVADERLCALLAVEVLDLLRARKHAGLFAVGRIKAHRVLRHGVPFARHDDFATRQARARRESLVDIGCGVDAFEPIAQQRLEPGVVQAQQVGQARQGLVRGRSAGLRR